MQLLRAPQVRVGNSALQNAIAFRAFLAWRYNVVMQAHLALLLFVSLAVIAMGVAFIATAGLH